MHPPNPPAFCSGAVQAGAIAFGLFYFTSKVEGSINGQSLPDAYTARNIAVTVRTIIVGLLYLVTFIFSANTVGLTGGLRHRQLSLFSNCKHVRAADASD